MKVHICLKSAVATIATIHSGYNRKKTRILGSRSRICALNATPFSKLFCNSLLCHLPKITEQVKLFIKLYCHSCKQNHQCSLF